MASTVLWAASAVPSRTDATPCSTTCRTFGQTEQVLRSSALAWKLQQWNTGRRQEGEQQKPAGPRASHVSIILISQYKFRES